MSPSICILVVYFGKFPTTFNLLLDSMYRNSDVDFIVVTDNEAAAICKKNVKILQTDLPSIRLRASKALAIDVYLERPYDLCDIKPMYGHIFAHELQEYDFWGYMDSDIVLGRIRHFITDAILAEYEKILMAGFFSLTKNNDRMNSMYKSRTDVVDWRICVTSKKNFGFDEWNGMYKIFIASSIPYYAEHICADIKVDYHDIRVVNGGNYSPQVLYYENGRILRQSRERLDEFLLIHLQKRPMQEPDAQTMVAPRKYFAPDKIIGGESVTVSEVEMKRINGKSLTGSLYFFYRRAKRKIKKHLTGA